MKPQSILGKLLREAIVKNAEERFASVEKKKVVALSCVLDPRFKKVHFNNNVNAATAVNYLQQLITREKAKNSRIMQGKATALAETTNKSSIWDFKNVSF